MKKLKANPEKPYTHGEIVKAMGELHKLVLKQSHAYGGKNHKFLPAEVVEEKSLFAIVAGDVDEVLEEGAAQSYRLLDLAERRAKDLEDHLKTSEDKKAATLVHHIIKYIAGAIEHLEKGGS